MRLTHIKLSGFKSFVDPTDIAVPGRLVAVIGPNGCGKSNVIDAVRWVLGEASAKQLRGESMQDVIFNGATTRRPASRASVELVFNNDDHTLQGAWGQYAEVAIKRQLTRQGESTYYINNQIVRRRDITDLFLGTGVGARGYAVIEQGMISRIIEARPEELRVYIEEAAGVSKYKERRRETENRLRDTREHLQRLADVQSELDRQVEKLQRQAKTAERYQTLKAQLAQQQNLLDYLEWQHALADADTAAAAHQQHQARQDALAAQIQTLSDEAHRIQQHEQTQQQQVHELNNQRALLREQWARLEEQIRHRQNLQQRFEREQAQAQMQQQRLQQEAAQLTEQQQTLMQDIEEQQLMVEEWRMKVAEHEARLPENEAQAHATEQARENQQNEIARLQRELAVKQQQHRHAEQSLQQGQQRTERLQQELIELALPDEHEVAEAEATAALEKAQVEALEETLVQCEESLAKQQTALQTAAQQQQQLSQQQFALSAQIDAQTALLPRDGGKNDFWAETDYAHTPALWQQMQVAAPWQHAVSVALGQHLQARMAEDYVPPARLPENAAVWVNRQPHQTTVSSLPAPILQHISCPAEFQPALNVWLAQVGCADNLADALAKQAQLHNGQALVTPEGHWVDAVSVCLFTEGEGNDLLERQQHIRELTEQLAALQQPLANAQQQYENAHTAVQTSTEQRIQCQNQLKQQQQTFQATLKRATELLTRTNQGQLRREHIRQETAQISAEQELHSQLHRQTAADADTLSQGLAELEAHQHDLQQQYLNQQQTLKQAQLTMLEARRQQGMAEMAVARLQQQQQTAAQERERLLAQSEEWQTRQSELALAHEAEAPDGEQQNNLDELNTQIEAANQAYDDAQRSLATLQQQLQTHYEQQQTLNLQLPESQAATQQALLQQQEALLNAKRFHDTLTAAGADITSLAELAASMSGSNNLSAEIGDLAQRINALGAVNLAALQELDEAAERQRYYTEQTTDVQSAIALLEEAIARIDDETKTRFKTTFDAVNDKVQTYFPTLFGGGEATLQMVGDDLLSAGVSIMARPPGKKNSTIYLLSGGEKALTAMSLVFALFSLNPAPFCLLDEVDAPLDDANTTRFCRLVAEMSAQTQFLYISHNRLTMEMAEQLVGVTMQEKGVSRIVDVDIRQALSLAEA